MIIYVNDKKIEVELGRNNDGSRYIEKAYDYETGDEIPDEELDTLQDLADDQINAMWG